jgi:hypothetical protein
MLMELWDIITQGGTEEEVAFPGDVLVDVLFVGFSPAGDEEESQGGEDAARAGSGERVHSPSVPAI